MTKSGATHTPVFTTKAVVALNQAYDEACEILKLEGASSKVRAEVGQHILSLARIGETDAHRICALAVQVGLGYVPHSLIVKAVA